MAPTDLRTYVGASSADDAYIEQCWHAATEIVGAHAGTANVPTDVFDRAVLEVGSELFHRRQAPNGITQFATQDGGAAVRVARDPMIGAYPILAPFVGLGIA